MRVTHCIQYFLILLIQGSTSSGMLSGSEIEEPFFGTLTYAVAYEKMETPLRYYSDGEHLRVEAGREGDPHLIWLVGLEDIDGVVLLSPFNRSYTIEPDGPRQRPGPPRDGDKKKKRQEAPFEIPEPVADEYMGLDCLHYFLETDGPDTEVWILKNAMPFPMSVLRLWDDLGEAAPAILRICKEHHALPVRVERKNWRGKSIFSMTLAEVDETMPGSDLFAIPEDYSLTSTGSPRGGGGKPGGGRSGGGRSGPPPGGGGGRPR